MDAPRDGDVNHQKKPAVADVSKPLAGVVICCTAIPPERRTELEKQIRQLGGVHTYDLVVDVTHLIVGNYDTPKYRHVAKDRYDVKAMDGGWIAALTELWTNDAAIDLPAVEAQWRLLPLETNGPHPGDDDRGRLACSISGFHDLDERQLIIDRIVDNGGIYLADLDRKNVTHLIVNEPKGNKFEAARKWGMYTVSLAWLDQSIERGMILNEECFDPALPPEEQGRRAWLRPSERPAAPARAAAAGAKRSLSAMEPAAAAAAAAQRKLRRTTSMKLGGQRDNIWGDIMTAAATNDSSARTEPADDRVEVVDSAWDLAAKHAPPEAVFFSCCFLIAGFDQWQFDIMTKVISDLGGAILDEMDDFSMIQDGSSRRCLLYVVVPQESRPDTHPEMPPPGRLPVRKVTEFFIERCLHAKTLFDPQDHVLGRPFPHFPIDAFAGLTMSTSGFAGIDLLHVEKTVRCMGARYAPRLNESVSVLLCSSLGSTRKDKIKLAKENDIPIVRADWLWSCVATGTKLPVRDFLFPELRQDPSLSPRPRAARRPESRGAGLGSTAQLESASRPQSRDRQSGHARRVSSAAKAAAVTSAEPTSAATGPPVEALPSHASGLDPTAAVPPAPATTGTDRRVSAPAAAAPPVQASSRRDHFVDRSGFASEDPAQGTTAGSRRGRPQPGSLPHVDTFGSGIVQRPPRQLSGATAKPAVPQDATAKPAEPVEPAGNAEPSGPENPAENRGTGTSEAPVVPEAASEVEQEPVHNTAAPPSPPPDPPALPAQTSDEGCPADKPGDGDRGDHEKRDPRRDEDQRAAERAAMASSIMASKLNSLAGAKLADGLDDEAGAKPARRRKGIFGRAVSNVSAASSASHDSAVQPQQQNGALGAGDEGLLRSRSDGALFGIAAPDAPADDEQDPSSTLPSTQIGYHDAEGAQRKAEMLQRMLAGELGPGAALPPIPQPPPRRRLPVSASTSASTTRVTRSTARR